MAWQSHPTPGPAGDRGVKEASQEKPRAQGVSRPLVAFNVSACWVQSDLLTPRGASVGAVGQRLELWFMTVKAVGGTQ